MTKELDPHHLVALMNFTLASEKDPTPRPIRSRSPKGLTFGGPTDNYPISFKAFPILDAIAAISISGIGPQVIAVALQLDTQRQQIRLTITANQSFKDDLVSYLEAVWGKLQALSKAYAGQRLTCQGPDRDCGGSPKIPADVAISSKVAIFRDIYRFCFGKQIKGPDLDCGGSPKMPADRTISSEAAVFRDIYQFCVGKQKKRMDKWLGGLTSLAKQLIQLRGKKNLQGFELNLYRASTLLQLEQQLLPRLYHHPKNELKDAKWEKIYRRSMLVAKQAALALADRNGCEILAQKLTGIELPSPNLLINWNSRTMVHFIFYSMI